MTMIVSQLRLLVPTCPGLIDDFNKVTKISRESTTTVDFLKELSTKLNKLDHVKVSVLAATKDGLPWDAILKADAFVRNYGRHVKDFLELFAKTLTNKVFPDNSKGQQKDKQPEVNKAESTDSEKTSNKSNPDNSKGQQKNKQPEADKSESTDSETTSGKAEPPQNPIEEIVIN